MSKNKDTGGHELTIEDLQRFANEWENMSDGDRDLVKQMMCEMLGNEDSNEPDDLNAHYYTYEGPERYNQLLMLSFGRKDSPSEYIYEAGDMLYPNSSCHAFTLGDLLKKKNQSALFNICDREHETHWRHGLTLEKSADYSDRTTSYMTLLDGRGTYPSKNVNDMEAYTRRFLDGKLRQPNFKTVRQHIRDFEEENTIM